MEFLELRLARSKLCSRFTLWFFQPILKLFLKIIYFSFETYYSFEECFVSLEMILYILLHTFHMLFSEVTYQMKYEKELTDRACFLWIYSVMNEFLHRIALKQFLSLTKKWSYRERKVHVTLIFFYKFRRKRNEKRVGYFKYETVLIKLHKKFQLFETFVFRSVFLLLSCIYCWRQRNFFSGCF